MSFDMRTNTGIYADLVRFVPMVAPTGGPGTGSAMSLKEPAIIVAADVTKD